MLFRNNYGHSHLVLAALFICLICVTSVSLATAEKPAAKLSTSTADHSKFEELKQSFATGPDVTKACLTCHTEASKQLHKTKHWNWQFTNPDNGEVVGKKTIINNFCLSITSNLARCTSCHIGYGWKDDSFDFSSEQNVDCLVCHDTTDTYKKFPTAAGHPNYKEKVFPKGSKKVWKVADLSKVAQSVGKARRENCGACHFYGGGGDAVKHGDLDSSLKQPKKYLDVHMDADGLDFSCGKCHLSDSHEVTGSRYAPTATDDKGALIRGNRDGRNPTTCVACHGNSPHPPGTAAVEKLNSHTDKIACQTCHIPAFARGNKATKMTWDWSTAGKDITIPKDKYGKPVYLKKKGSFQWKEAVKPNYKWYNGTVKRYILGDRINENGVTNLTMPVGDIADPASRIYPFKLHKGKQISDSVYKYLIAPQLWEGYWKHWDWDKASRDGMKAANLEYSGTFDWVETVLYTGICDQGVNPAPGF